MVDSCARAVVFLLTRETEIENENTLVMSAKIVSLLIIAISVPHASPQTVAAERELFSKT